MVLVSLTLVGGKQEANMYFNIKIVCTCEKFERVDAMQDTSEVCVTLGPRERVGLHRVARTKVFKGQNLS